MNRTTAPDHFGTDFSFNVWLHLKAATMLSKHYGQPRPALGDISDQHSI